MGATRENPPSHRTWHDHDGRSGIAQNTWDFSHLLEPFTS
jgi:hypothetical protein